MLSRLETPKPNVEGLFIVKKRKREGPSCIEKLIRGEKRRRVGRVKDSKEAHQHLPGGYAAEGAEANL